jgi:hypothetical protein
MQVVNALPLRRLQNLAQALGAEPTSSPIIFMKPELEEMAIGEGMTPEQFKSAYDALFEDQFLPYNGHAIMLAPPVLRQRVMRENKQKQQ